MSVRYYRLLSGILSLFIISLTFLPQTATAANLVYEETFEGSNPFGTYVSKQIETDYGFTVVTNPVYDGLKAGRFELHDTDPMNNNGTRAEVSFPPVENVHRWYAFSVYFPSEYYGADSDDELITQWHQGGGLTPPISLRIQADKLRFRVKPTPTTTEWFELGTVPKNRWVPFVFHIIHRSDSSGLTEVWMDGTKVVNRSGDNAYTTADNSDVKVLPNWKLGIYKSAWNDGNTSDVSKRVLYYDNVRIGNENAILADMTARGSTPPPTNISPIANAGLAQAITLPTTTATLNGSASSDTDGSIVNYLWKQVSGPVSTTISAPTQSFTSVSGLNTAGIYTFELTVTDNAGATAKATTTITVNPQPVNILPTVNAGTDKTITLPTNSVTLSAAAADPDGSIASYTWSKVSGGTATITSPTSSSTTATGLTQGIYVFRITVTDNRGGSSSDDVTVTVNGVTPSNIPPTANAGADQTITLPTNSTTLSGFGSDVDGSITKYAWSKVSGGTATIASPSTAATAITGLTQGVYVFRLTVTDNVGAIAYDDATVTVNAAPTTTPTPGLVYNYYHGQWSSLPNFSTLIPVKSGIISTFSISPATQSNEFGFTYKGLIKTTNAGTYTFYTSSDDGSDLWINNQRIVNNDGTHSAREESGTISLAANTYYPIEVRYFERSSSQSLKVSWKGPGFSKKTIPSNALFQDTTGTSSSQQVTSFTLVDSATEQDVLTINDGQTISLGALRIEKANIRANVTSIGSVKFELSGTESKTLIDNMAPYALHGDDGSGNYYYGTWNPPALGTYVLKATPYPEDNALGTPGTSKTITFTITN